MLPSSVLIVSDDTEFARTLTARWQAERHVPEITIATGSVWHPASASNHDLIIIGPLRETSPGAILAAANASPRTAAIYFGEEERNIAQLRAEYPHLLVVPRTDGWAGTLILVAIEALRRVEANQRAQRAEALALAAQGHATLGRYMLEMRPSVNNALTSVLGNADLLLLEPGHASAESREQTRDHPHDGPAARTKSCSDSHRSPPRCGPVRKNLKLRRSRHLTRWPRGHDLRRRPRNLHEIQPVANITRVRNQLRQVARELQLFRWGFTRGGVDVVMKVLVVDDSQAETRLLQSVLQQAGFHSVAINDPTRVEEKIEEERPNVILLDVVMPQRNGFQVCRDLKSQETYAKIPVILVTSKTAPSDRYWGEQQGANGYVAKPFTADELISAVKRFA